MEYTSLSFLFKNNGKEMIYDNRMMLGKDHIIKQKHVPLW